MKLKNNSFGFSAVDLVLVFVLIALLGVGGYMVYARQHKKETTTTSVTQQTEATDVSPAPQVKSTADLDTALTALDQNDPAAANTSDTTQLDADLATF